MATVMSSEAVQQLLCNRPHGQSMLESLLNGLGATEADLETVKGCRWQCVVCKYTWLVTDTRTQFRCPACPVDKVVMIGTEELRHPQAWARLTVKVLGEVIRLSMADRQAICCALRGLAKEQSDPNGSRFKIMLSVEEMVALANQLQNQ